MTQFIHVRESSESRFAGPDATLFGAPPIANLCVMGSRRLSERECANLRLAHCPDGTGGPYAKAQCD